MDDTTAGFPVYQTFKNKCLSNLKSTVISSQKLSSRNNKKERKLNKTKSNDHSHSNCTNKRKTVNIWTTIAICLSYS